MAVTTSHDTQELLTHAIGPACHELRSPLAVVYGFAKMLASSELDETTQRYVTQIVNGAQRLDTMLDTFSQLGRIAAGRIHPTIESVSVKSVVDDVAGADAERISVDAGSDVHAKVDPEWLAGAIVGVVEAVCFEEGMQVRICWTSDAHEVVLQVVPKSDLPMIDVDPDKSSLVLALSRMRLVAMGGSLEGRDDRVTLTLPRG